MESRREGSHRAAVHRGRLACATIDPTGRVQLPPDALALFPDRRAVLRIEGGRVVLEPPGDDG